MLSTLSAAALVLALGPVKLSARYALIVFLPGILVLSGCSTEVSQEEESQSQLRRVQGRPRQQQFSFAEAPRECDREYVRRLVEGFFASYGNQAPQATLRFIALGTGRRFLATGSVSRVYRDVRGTVTNRLSLLGHLRQAHRSEERLELVALVVPQERGWHGQYDFSFRIRRSASDLPKPTWHVGKGVARCRIALLVYGEDDPNFAG